MAEFRSDRQLVSSQAMATGVQCVPATASLQEAGVMLSEAGVELLAVSEQDRVVGAISIRDLALKGCAAGHDPTCTSVSRIMESHPLVCRAEMPAAESLRLMRQRGVAVALVHDRNEQVVGVLSLLRLLDLLDDHEPHGPEPDYVQQVRGDAF